MQRLQKTVCAGIVLGLFLSLAGPAQAQVVYVQSSNYRTMPVSQSVAQTRTFVAPRYSSYSYGSSFSYGSGFVYGLNSPLRSSSFNGLAWNNRRSAPPIYSETRYLPESSYVDSGVTYQSAVSSPPVVTSRVVSSRPLVATQPRVVYEPTAACQTVVSSQPVTYSERVVALEPVRIYRMVESSPRVVRIEAVSPSEPVESKKIKSKSLESMPRVTVVTELSDGRRVKTYRYEYELDHRPRRVTIEFDSQN